MGHTPEQRREFILRWLQEHTSLSIEDIVKRLEVSLMTVHRDLDQMVEAGQVQKSYGRVELVKTTPEDHGQFRSAACAMCHSPVPYRTEFVIHLTNGSQLNACCAHCGLMLMHHNGDVVSALTRDFILCRMVNVRQAAYVLESRVHLCCVPGVLCFSSAEDAASFVTGFGGITMDFAQASHYLAHSHAG